MSKCSVIEWIGNNPHYVSMTFSSFTVQKEHIQYFISIKYFATKQIIEIKSDDPVDVEVLRTWLDEIRRFEYLFQGAFHILETCKIDGKDITEEVRKVELGYFQNAEYKHFILLNLSDRQYKKFFLKWMKLEKKIRMINQTMLYSSNVRGLPVDLRLALASECYESLSEFLENQGYIAVKKESNRHVIQKCPYCQQEYKITIRGKRTFSCCLLSILEEYGHPVFSAEYRRKKSLVSRIVKTRNKVFHVKPTLKLGIRKKVKKDKRLNKKYCRFYSIKLDWMYRYIILLLLGIDRNELDKAVIPFLEKFEKTFPNLVYRNQSY